MIVYYIDQKKIEFLNNMYKEHKLQLNLQHNFYLLVFQYGQF
jgi:hypothetical protein